MNRCLYCHPLPCDIPPARPPLRHRAEVWEAALFDEAGFNIAGWDRQPAPYPVFGRYTRQVEAAFGHRGHALRGWDIL